jgi:dTDP-4-dehydrorhamnose reductase
LKKVLVLGSSGLLGSSLSRSLSTKFEVVGTHFTHRPKAGTETIYLNVAFPEMLEKIIESVSPHYVINCIGATSVEECERLPEKAMLLNAIFPHKVARASNKFGFRFVQVSTDHYDTPKYETRNEFMHPIALNSYGYSKLVGEQLVLNEATEALILRTNFFGVSPRGDHSILDFAINSLSNSTPIFGYEDVSFTPIGVTQVGKFLVSEMDSPITGVLNLSGSESISKFTFLKEVAVGLGLDPQLVVSARSSELSTWVTRPTILSLDNSKLLGRGFNLPSLKDMIREELSYRVVL